MSEEGLASPEPWEGAVARQEGEAPSLHVRPASLTASPPETPG